MSLNTLLIWLKFFLLTMVDNLITYIENENCKDFIMEDGERLISFYETFNFKDLLWNILIFCVCVCVDTCVCVYI